MGGVEVVMECAVALDGGDVGLTGVGKDVLLRGFVLIEAVEDLLLIEPVAALVDGFL